MSISSHAEHKQYAFEVYCKTVLKNKARNLYQRNVIKDRYELKLEDMLPGDYREPASEDKYSFNCPVTFEVDGRNVTVCDNALSKALACMVPKYRYIILLSFFLEYSDEKIARLINVDKSTIYRRKERALQKMRELIGENSE